jgi:hypothetical protein
MFGALVSLFLQWIRHVKQLFKHLVSIIFGLQLEKVRVFICKNIAIKYLKICELTVLGRLPERLKPNFAGHAPILENELL